MGQEESSLEAPNREIAIEQLSEEVALKFAQKCYSQLELYCFKEVFKKLAESESDLTFWSETSLCHFLEIPDVLGAGPVVFRCATFLGAFPFASQAPAILTMEALLKVITIMTQRYLKVVKKGSGDRFRLLYGSLAVMDRRLSETWPKPKLDVSRDADDDTDHVTKAVAGFAIDQPSGDDAEDEDDDEDPVALAALDSLDAIEAIKFGEHQNITHSIIPSDNFLKIVELLLLIAPLGAQEPLSTYVDRLNNDNIGILRQTAQNILSLFGLEQPGITFKTFKQVVPYALPFLFDGLNPLFEHFLFDKSLDLSKRTSMSPPTSPMSPQSPSSPGARRQSRTLSISQPLPVQRPLLPAGGDILDFAILSQLSFFIRPSSIFHRLHSLYTGKDSGFSMGAFETSVFTWQAPSILLVSGSILPSEPANSRERAFADSLPPHRFPSSASKDKNSPNTRVTYGVYVPFPWKATHRTPLSSEKAILFQLGPVHDVFSASAVSKDHLTFDNTQNARHPGIAFGSPLERSTSSVPHSPSISTATLGPVSLHLDAALEYAVFTHSSAGGGSYHSSLAPARRRSDWQDRFEIEALEVWGLGGDSEAEGRKKNIEFEEREARFRREGRASMSAGQGSSYEADKELLRMAGLIGHGESGGSMG